MKLMDTLSLDLPTVNHGTPETVSKKFFADMRDVSLSRVSQWIAAGMPTTPNGRVNIAQANQWLADNTDPNRRRFTMDDDEVDDAAPGLTRSAAGTLKHEQARLMRVKADRAEGRVIDRDRTLRALESHGRAMRDGWIGWVNRAAPEIAAATGADLSTVTAALDRLVREQLISLSDMEIKGVDDVP